MGTADLHIHSVYSDGTATVEAILHHASEHTDLDVIAITDHDTLDGSLRAMELASRFRVNVMPGMEISTREGHLLALGLHTPAPPGLSYVETAERVRLFGGLPFAAHPTRPLVSSIAAALLSQIVARYPGLLAGIEAENGSIAHLQDNGLAQALRWDLQLPGIGNSDAHTLASIGNGRTAFAGHTAAHLRDALDQGLVIPLPARRDRQFLPRALLRLVMRAGLGLVEGLDEREEMGQFVRWQRWSRAST